MHSSVSHHTVQAAPRSREREHDRPSEAPLLPMLPSSHYHPPLGNQLPDSESHPQVSQLGASPRTREAQGARLGDVTRSGMIGKCLDHYHSGLVPGVCVAPLKTPLTFSKGKPFLAASHRSQHQAAQGSLSVGLSKPPSRNVSSEGPGFLILGQPGS